MGKEKIKNKTKMVLQETKRFCINNRKELMVFIPTVLISASRCMNSYSKMRDNINMTKNREKRIYDYSLGSYWDLRKKLTNNERLTIDYRKQQGERLGDILQDMGVLK